MSFPMQKSMNANWRVWTAGKIIQNVNLYSSICTYSPYLCHQQMSSQQLLQLSLALLDYHPEVKAIQKIYVTCKINKNPNRGIYFFTLKFLNAKSIILKWQMPFKMYKNLIF